MGFAQTASIAAFTAIVTLFGYSVTASYQRANEKDRALESEKRDTYKRLLELLFEILRQETRETTTRVRDMEKRFFNVSRDKTVYSSDAVLDLWIRFKNMGESPEPNYVLALVGELLVEVRTDLGHFSSRHSARELLSTFITDIDSIDLPTL